MICYAILQDSTTHTDILTIICCNITPRLTVISIVTVLGRFLPLAARMFSCSYYYHFFFERERCDAMRCDAMRCDAMRCDAVRCDAMRCTPHKCPGLNASLSLQLRVLGLGF